MNDSKTAPKTKPKPNGNSKQPAVKPKPVVKGKSGPLVKPKPKPTQADKVKSGPDIKPKAVPVVRAKPGPVVKKKPMKALGNKELDKSAAFPQVNKNATARDSTDLNTELLVLESKENQFDSYSLLDENTTVPTDKNPSVDEPQFAIEPRLSPVNRPDKILEYRSSSSKPKEPEVKPKPQALREIRNNKKSETNNISQEQADYKDELKKESPVKSNSWENKSQIKKFRQFTPNIKKSTSDIQTNLKSEALPKSTGFEGNPKFQKSNQFTQSDKNKSTNQSQTKGFEGNSNLKKSNQFQPSYKNQSTNQSQLNLIPDGKKTPSSKPKGYQDNFKFQKSNQLTPSYKNKSTNQIKTNLKSDGKVVPSSKTKGFEGNSQLQKPNQLKPEQNFGSSKNQSENALQLIEDSRKIVNSTKPFFNRDIRYNSGTEENNNLNTHQNQNKKSFLKNNNKLQSIKSPGSINNKPNNFWKQQEVSHSKQEKDEKQQIEQEVPYKYETNKSNLQEQHASKQINPKLAPWMKDTEVKRSSSLPGEEEEWETDSDSDFDSVIFS